MVGDLVKHIGGYNMDEGEEGLQEAVKDEVEEGEIVDEGEVLEEGEEVEDDRRDHQNVRVQECSQNASCEKGQEAGGGGQNSSSWRGSEEEGHLKEPKRRCQEDGIEDGHVGPGKHKMLEESTPRVSSCERVLSEGLPSFGEEAAPKHKKNFINDEENNVVRKSGLGEAIGKPVKGNPRKDEKQKNPQGVEKKKKSVKDGDMADRFIKVVAMTANKHEMAGDVTKKKEQAEDRGSVQGMPKDIAAARAGQVENLDHSRVKDAKQNKEKTFSSTAKDGLNGVQMPTNQVPTSSSLSYGREGSGVKVEGSTSKILGAERSGGEKKGSENSVEKSVKTIKKRPMKKGKHIGEVWEGFSFEKLAKVKHERPAEETAGKSGNKRKAEEISSGGKEEGKKSKKRCTATEVVKKNTGSTQEEKKNVEVSKKGTDDRKRNTEEEKKNVEAERKRDEDKEKNTGEGNIEAEKKSNEDVKKSTEDQDFLKKGGKRNVEEKQMSQIGREETVGKKGQSDRFENKSQDTEEKRKGKGGEKCGKKGKAEQADESQEKKKGNTCNASKSKKTKDKKEEVTKLVAGSGKESREDSRSSAKKLKEDEKSKDNARVGRDGKIDEDGKDSSSSCSVEELESWKNEVLETRARLTQQEFEARVRNEAVLQQLAVACRQVGELEKREVKASEELEGLRSEVASLRNEVARLKDELAGKKKVEVAGMVEGNDEKADEVRGLEQMETGEVGSVELGSPEGVRELSIEVSSDEEETSESGEEKMIIDETSKCEEVEGKASLSEYVGANALRQETPAAKEIVVLKKNGKGAEKIVERVSKAGEEIARTQVLSRKVQRQEAKRKSKVKEHSGPFQCSMDECQDSWVKLPGWERKALTHFLRDHDPMINDMMVKDKVTGEKFMVEDLLEYVGQCTQQDCYAILGVKARSASDSKYELKRHFQRHYKSLHPKTEVDYAFLVEEHVARFREQDGPRSLSKTSTTNI